MRTERGADAVNRLFVFFQISIESGIDRLFQGLKPVSHRDDICAEDLHARHVRRLFRDIDLAHVNITLQAEIRGGRRKCHAMLPGTGLGDQFLLAHEFCKKSLPHAVIELMSAGMIQILALEINLAPRLQLA